MSQDGPGGDWFLDTRLPGDDQLEGFLVMKPVGLIN